MSYLLLIDEDPEQLATLVHAAFPACNYRIEVARTGLSQSSASVRLCPLRSS